MEKELKSIVDDYAMGFIASHDVVLRYIGILDRMGAGKELHDMLDAECRKLAAFLCEIIDGKQWSLSQYATYEQPE